MRHEEFSADLTVIGGGLAGCCAAIAAARQGASVALVQNRPVLGGNSSSEVRVWVCGATGHGSHRYARETGIIGEMFVENQFRNLDGNPYYWDLVVLEAVRDEPNITLFLNTDVRSVESDGPDDTRVIRAVTGWMMGSEREIRFTSPTFIDCTGDGFVGFLAGAWYRTGCESRSEYDESWAPEDADDSTLGSTILFYTKDVGQPVKYVPPKFARDITTTSIPERRIIRTDLNGCAYWWIEWGGEKDVVHDNEEIRDELQAAIYGIWDHIKNSGKFDADTLTLEWIGAVPGKREYRRFVGDHTMTQHDVLGQEFFPDRVAFGGWSIDLHPPGGMYATERGSRHWHADGNYHIPLRTLYSRNVTNMWMAGRNISCSHVAFGSTRVMATCAVVGEAAGTAAALATQRGTSPRELATQQIALVHRAMVRSDASLLGVENTDPADLALAARASASSTLRNLAVETSASTLALDTHVGMVLPADPGLGSLELLVDADSDTELTLEVHHTGNPQNYIPTELVETATTSVPAGQKQWVTLTFDWTPGHPQNAFVVVRENRHVALHCSDSAEPGTLFFRHRTPPPGEIYTEQWREWKHILHRASVCYRLGRATDAFDARHVIGGYARPYGGPQMWASEPLAWDEQPWVELAWDAPATFREVALILDDEVEEDLINLHHHRTPYDVMPGLVRNYQIQAEVDGDWTTLVDVQDNRRRHRVHQLDTAVTARRLRVVIESTNGAPRAHVVAVRVYAEPR
ncbi:FAD-dependent oxidoreductase [Actinopolymorpha sp. B9G3]|uniref:FAD-dependent oxidoreductase n=1 Tax=Actinopolymorpha sp. B9G3 TaxID=3158970 RepID=UPI0032D93861